MLKLQKEINYEKSNVERDELINKLSATLDKEDLEHMVGLSKKVAADKTMQEINELQLYSFMIQHTKDIDGYQNLKKHIEYLRIYINISWNELSNEIKDSSSKN